MRVRRALQSALKDPQVATPGTGNTRLSHSLSRYPGHLQPRLARLLSCPLPEMGGGTWTGGMQVAESGLGWSSVATCR